MGIYTINDLIATDFEFLNEQTVFAESHLQRWKNLAVFYNGGVPVDEIDEIDQQIVEQLADVDIFTVGELEAACAKEVAEQTDLQENSLKMWIGEAIRRDIDHVMELPKIGKGRAKELAKAGIFTVSGLAEADSDNLASQTNFGQESLHDRIQFARTHQSADAH